MVKRLRVLLMVCFVVAVSIVSVQFCVPVPGIAMAGESTTDSLQEQLHQKLMQRKQLLDVEAEEIKKRFEFGSETSKEYLQAKEAALRAGIELCQSKEEQLDIYKQILDLYTQIEQRVEVVKNMGQLSMSDLRKSQVARLEIEIELLKVQLN